MNLGFNSKCSSRVCLSDDSPFCPIPTPLCNSTLFFHLQTLFHTTQCQNLLSAGGTVSQGKRGRLQQSLLKSVRTRVQKQLVNVTHFEAVTNAYLQPGNHCRPVPLGKRQALSPSFFQKFMSKNGSKALHTQSSAYGQYSYNHALLLRVTTVKYNDSYW